MKRPSTPRIPFEHRMQARENIAAAMYLPVHTFLLPILLASMMLKGTLSEADANFLCYGLGVCFVFSTCMGYLRRDFDPLCDQPVYVIAQVLIHYGMMLLMNLVVNSILLTMISEGENPNNAAVFTMAGDDFGKVAALSIFMAPILEEVIFRGAIFGALHSKNRTGAYLISVLLFSAYHVWGYLAIDWHYIVFIVQYIPISYLLCRIYERTSTIWASIFLHMLVNAVSLNLLEAIGGIV